MLDQSFSASNLQRIVSLRDIIRYRIGRNKEEIHSTIELISEEISKKDFEFSKLTESKTDVGTIYQASSVHDFLALKKLNSNIRRLYKVKQANRHLIIRQILVLIRETMPMSIIRLDIKQFYPSIDKNKILKKLNQDSLLSYKSKVILNSLFDSVQLVDVPGLPKGLNVSASMSELYMREIDEHIRQIHGVYYYARYVDDIVIFCHCNDELIIEEVAKLLAKRNLTLNPDKRSALERLSCNCARKCKCTTTKTLSFEYLGYQFEFSNIAGVSNELMVSLARKKINKIKTKIVRAFLDHLKSKNFDLLEKRISLLTGNYTIKENSEGRLKAGIYYNYPFIDKNASCLVELTTFLRNMVNASSGSFGSRVRSSLSNEQRRRLIKYDFKSGFVDKRECDFDIDEIKSIKKCWLYG